MSATRRALAGLAWLATLAIAVVVLHVCAASLPAPPWPPTGTAWGDWLQARGPIGAAFSVLRLVALVVAWYLVAVTALTLLARFSGSRSLARVALQLTPRLARAAIRPLLGAGLSVSLLAGATAPLLAGASAAHAGPAPAATASAAAPGTRIASQVLLSPTIMAGSSPAPVVSPPPVPSPPLPPPALPPPPLPPPALPPPPTIVVTPLDDPPIPPSIPGTTTAGHIDEHASPSQTGETASPTSTTTLPPPGRMSPVPTDVGEPPNQSPNPTTPTGGSPTTTTTPPVPSPTEAPPGTSTATTTSDAGRTFAGAGGVAIGPIARSLSDPDRWVIAPGDHLWHVAETTLGRSWGRTVTDDEIVPYWDALIAANRDRLVDRDNADLVIPGQELVLPPRPPPPG